MRNAAYRDTALWVTSRGQGPSTAGGTRCTVHTHHTLRPRWRLGRDDEDEDKGVDEQEPSETRKIDDLCIATYREVHKPGFDIENLSTWFVTEICHVHDALAILSRHFGLDALSIHHVIKGEV